jgi:hypothetical protein
MARTTVTLKFAELKCGLGNRHNPNPDLQKPDLGIPLSKLVLVLGNLLAAAAGRGRKSSYSRAGAVRPTPPDPKPARRKERHE